jgi:hypothetical protein
MLFNLELGSRYVWGDFSDALQPGARAPRVGRLDALQPGARAPRVGRLDALQPGARVALRVGRLDALQPGARVALRVGRLDALQPGARVALRMERFDGSCLGTWLFALLGASWRNKNSLAVLWGPAGEGPQEGRGG